ncbi:MAG TPA: aminotransferase class I/II-fold pyridoxal phosphate-dependent enzyme, partial [Candidatus Dormibacteraeota bacterium]|nr:aminotransferase class I/II-fold pyridoxal phosphate-dependent enzyme [Candidatus Dormibacteraeota bacterium]
DAANDALRLYPSPTAAPAREAIARRFGLAPNQVTVGNGGDELIELCFRAFADAGERVAFPTPTYPLLEPLCRIHEAIPSPHPTELFDELPPSLGPDPAPLKFIVNPNSPTGTWIDPAQVERAIEQSPGVVAIDEAYVDFAPMNVAGFIPRYKNMLVLRTMSKSYALAGMRIGYAIGDPGLISALEAVKDSYNLDRLAIVAAVAAVEDDAHHRQIVDHVVSERAWLGHSLRAMGFEVAPSQTNFLFVKPPPGQHGPAVADALRERRILVRRYDLDPIAGWLRITIGTRDQHDRLLEALKET